MPALPSGTVTLLFTDIEGSTQLLRRLGDAYAGVLAEHQRLLCEAFAAHGGRDVDTQGGGCGAGGRGGAARPGRASLARGRRYLDMAAPTTATADSVAAS